MRRMIIVGGVVAGLIAAGAGIAVATGQQDDDSSDRPITGPALDRATRAALGHTGGGRVTETEVGDEEGYYEIEVTMPDGRQIDVHLGEDFAVLDSAEDSDEDR